jgi:hypothetical protein
MNAILRATLTVIIYIWHYISPILPWLKLEILLPIVVFVELMTSAVTFKYHQTHSRKL